MWNVEYTDEFGRWWEGLKEKQQDAIDRSIGLLQRLGPALGRPHVDSIKRSRHANMKELRIQWSGEASPIGFSSLSIRDDTRSCSSADARPVISGSTTA